MKYKLFQYISPFLFLTSGIFYTRQSLAKPSPVFQPIIGEIKTRLPSDLKMRLPTVVPTFDRNTTLYSFLPSDNSKLTIELDDLKMEFFMVLIGDTADCSKQQNPQDCLVAAVGVTEDPIKSQVTISMMKIYS